MKPWNRIGKALCLTVFCLGTACISEADRCKNGDDYQEPANYLLANSCMAIISAEDDQDLRLLETLNCLMRLREIEKRCEQKRGYGFSGTWI